MITVTTNDDRVRELEAQLAEAHAVQWEIIAQFRDAIDPDATERNDFSHLPLITRVEALRKLEPIAARVPQLEAEIESLKAGLRALADIRDEGARETNRWCDRALVLQAKVERLAEESTNADVLVDELSRAKWALKCAKDSEANAWAMRHSAVNLLDEQIRAWQAVAHERDAWRSRFRVLAMVVTKVWQCVRGGAATPSERVADASIAHAVRQVLYDLNESMNRVVKGYK